MHEGLEEIAPEVREDIIANFVTRVLPFIEGPGKRPFLGKAQSTIERHPAHQARNGAETYGEFIFVNNWLNPNDHPNEAWTKTEIMVEANTTNSTSYTAFPQTVVNGQATSGGNDQFRLREAFVRGGHFLGDTQPDAIFWAGERYYRREHVEIDDFYPLGLSGYGAGFEDLNVGIGKLAIAFLAGSRPYGNWSDGLRGFVGGIPF